MGDQPGPQAGQTHPRPRRKRTQHLPGATGLPAPAGLVPPRLQQNPAQEFGRPSQPTTAADIERTAAEVHRLTPTAPRQAALQVTAALAAKGKADAIEQAARAYVDLGRNAGARAPIRGRVAGFEEIIPAEILQAWYQRCSQDATDFTVRDQPLRAVTAAEAAIVAHAVTVSEIRRIVGADGVAVITEHGTLVDDVDRRLAAGDIGVVDPRPPVRSHATLEAQTRQAWSNQDTSSRRAIIERAGVDDLDPRTTWAQLPWPVATTYIRHFLDTHRGVTAVDHHPARRPARRRPPVRAVRAHRRDAGVSRTEQPKQLRSVCPRGSLPGLRRPLLRRTGRPRLSSTAGPSRWLVSNGP